MGERTSTGTAGSYDDKMTDGKMIFLKAGKQEMAK